MFTLVNFIAESNRIEGINRPPSDAEVQAHIDFLNAKHIGVREIEQFVSVVQPGAVLRDRIGLNVRVGAHHPPMGGPDIRLNLESLLQAGYDPYTTHRLYQNLHPFTDGNGRSGRALWLHMMGSAPIGFLHHWYYQSLADGDRRVSVMKTVDTHLENKR